MSEENNTPTPCLPQELIDTIITFLINGMHQQGQRGELLESLKACAAASRALLQVCQKEIFRVVCLHPRSIKIRGRRHRTKIDFVGRFNDLICSQPHIGNYVQALTYRLSDAWETDTVPTPAFKHLKMVKQFTVEMAHESIWARDRKGAYFLYKGGEHAQAVLDVARGDQIRSLKFRNLAIPSGIFPGMRGLEALELDECNAFVSGDFISEAPPMAQIKTLKIDGLSTLENVEGILSKDTELRPQFVKMLSKLEVLQVPAPMCPRIFRASNLLLSLTKGIRSLHLVSADSHSHALQHPLTHLDERSFFAMTSLSYTTHHSLILKRTLRDPFDRLFSDPVLLEKFTSLEEITVKITLEGCSRTMELGAFGNQWGEMDRVLAPADRSTCALPALKRVTLVIYVCDHSPEELCNILGQVKTRIAAQQFKGLHRLRKAGKLDFKTYYSAWTQKA